MTIKCNDTTIAHNLEGIAKSTDKRVEAATTALAQVLEAWPPAARVAILASDRVESQGDETEKSELARLVAYYIGKAVARYAQLHTIAEDSSKCARMTRRFPWHGTDISRSDHFYFVWFNFSGQCYLYRERARTFLNDFNRLRRIFSEEPVDVGASLKAIDRNLGEYIRHRGAHTHEWHQDHISYSTYKLVDFLAQHDPSYSVRRQDFYQDAKLDMAFHMDRAIEFMCEFFLTAPGDPRSCFARYGVQLSRLLSA